MSRFLAAFRAEAGPRFSALSVPNKSEKAKTPFAAAAVPAAEGFSPFSPFSEPYNRQNATLPGSAAEAHSPPANDAGLLAASAMPASAGLDGFAGLGGGAIENRIFDAEPHFPVALPAAEPSLPDPATADLAEHAAAMQAEALRAVLDSFNAAPDAEPWESAAFASNAVSRDIYAR